MAKYRKKPVVIEAEQWWPGGLIADVVEGEYVDDGHAFPAKCRTLEGWHGVSAGDYIITGVRGERYPCRADIFAETYEPA